MDIKFQPHTFAPAFIQKKVGWGVRRDRIPALEKRGKGRGEKAGKIISIFLGKIGINYIFDVPKVKQSEQFFEIMKYNNQARLTISSKKLVSILEWDMESLRKEI